MTFTRVSLMVATVSAAAIIPAISGAQTTATKPNIIYIYADDLGYGEIGPFGQKKIKTPNLDKFAAEGMKFTSHYTGTPVCAPARCNLLTGLHSGHAVVRGNYELGGYEDEKEGGHFPLPPHTLTVGKVLQQQGYVTGCVGKWGLGMHDTSGAPNRQGFDYFFGILDQKQAHNFYPTHLWENGERYPLDNEYVNVHENRGKKNPNVNFAKYHKGDHASDHMTSKALQFLADNKDKPFFLYYANPLPHASLQPKQEYVEPYLDQFEEKGPHLGNGYAPHATPRAAYAGMISQLDAEVGMLMDKLKELGLDENTLIMFSSDNGPTFNVAGVDTEFFNSAGDLRGRKGDVYEGGIRVPTLARWPGKIAPGSVTDHRSAQYDFLPTVADLLNVELPEPVDGISYLPTLLGKDGQKNHDYMYWEFPERGGKQAVTRMPWKIVKTNMRKNPDAAWELYNLESDPGEKSNVAHQHPDIVKELDALAREAHWHPQTKEWEFVDPKFETDEEN